MLAAIEAEELRTTVRGDEEVFTGFIRITAAVMSSTVKVGGIDHGALFTGGQIEAHDMLVVSRNGPDLVLGYE